MSRPVYETAADAAAEDQIAAAFGAAWGADLVRMRRLFPVDRAVVKGGSIVAWAEIKRKRRGRRDFGGQVLIDVDKAVFGVTWAEMTGKPFLFCIGFDDANVYARLDRECFRSLVIRGRKDRADAADVHPAVVLTADDFKSIASPDERKAA